MKNRTSLWFGLASLIACTVFLLSHSTHVTAKADDHRLGRTGAYQTWGYQPWWMAANWPELDLGLWRRLIFFEFEVAADGRIANIDALPSEWRSMGAEAARCGTAMDLAFTLFDKDEFERLFTSVTSPAVLLDEILALVEASDANGVHLDFEIYSAVSAEALSGFRTFVGRLSRALRYRFQPRILSVFAVAGAQQDLFDRRTLALVDFIVIQGYDAHWKSGPVAGAVAPLRGSHKLSWEKSLQHYLNLGAKRSRILFSVPYFGYEWPVISPLPGSKTAGPGKEMTYAPLPPSWVPRIDRSALEQGGRHGILRDEETGSPYYVYRDAEGGWWQGWFEDEASLREKFAFIKKEGLAGIAAFPLGYDAGRFDPLISGMRGQRPQCRAGSSSSGRLK